jgi:hypothetical protein
MRADVEVQVEQLLEGVGKLGCALAGDGWSDMNRRPLLNGIIVTPHGTIFLCTRNATGNVKSAKYLFGYYAPLIREQREKGRLVVAFITDGAKVNASLGKMLEEEFPDMW